MGTQNSDLCLLACFALGESRNTAPEMLKPPNTRFQPGEKLTKMHRPGLSQFERPRSSNYIEAATHINLCTRVDAFSIEIAWRVIIRSSFDREKHVFSIFSQPTISWFRDRNLNAPWRSNYIEYVTHPSLCTHVHDFSIEITWRVFNSKFDRLMANFSKTFFSIFSQPNFGIAIWTPPGAQNTSKT